MSDEKPKRIKDVTEIHVKQVAIARAADEGWIVGLDDCRVTAIPPRPVVNDESGVGRTVVRLPVTQWIVEIRPKSPPNKSVKQLAVFVEFAYGELYAADFRSEDDLH